MAIAASKVAHSVSHLMVVPGSLPWHQRVSNAVVKALVSPFQGVHPEFPALEPLSILTIAFPSPTLECYPFRRAPFSMSFVKKDPFSRKCLSREYLFQWSRAKPLYLYTYLWSLKTLSSQKLQNANAYTSPNSDATCC